MKKHELYKVTVNSAKEAEMFKQALLSLGEKVFEPFYERNCSDLIYDFDCKHWFCALFHISKETITFKELIKILVNAKEPLLTSEDGFELFEGDEYHEASFFKEAKVWQYVFGPSNKLKESHRVCKYKEESKSFSTKQAALDWIEKMNKPKEIELILSGIKIKVYNDVVGFIDGGYLYFELKPSDVEDIYHALKTLNNEKPRK